MIRALAIKELRESFLVLAVGALALSWTVGYVSGYSLLPNWVAYPLGIYERGSGIPFITTAFVYYCIICMGGLAIALGFKQSAWEELRGTYYFLLHRPISRREIFATKICVGITSIVGLYSIAILVHGCCGATPATHGGPFEWSMSLVAWRYVLIFPLIYLGAFISGLRPAAWYGTRFAPLVATIFWSILVSFVPFWSVAIVLSVVGYGFTLVGICHFAAERDY